MRKVTSWAVACSISVTPQMQIYKEEIFGPVLSVVRAKDYDEAVRLPSEHEYGNGVAIFTRDGDTARDFVNEVQVGMVGVNFAIPVPLVVLHIRWLEAFGLRRSQPARAGLDPILHQDQDRHGALAFGHQGRRRVHHPDDEVASSAYHISTIHADRQAIQCPNINCIALPSPAIPIVRH